MVKFLSCSYDHAHTLLRKSRKNILRAAAVVIVLTVVGVEVDVDGDTLWPQ